MKRYLFIGVMLVFIIGGCSKEDKPSSCVKESAKYFCENESCNHGVQVDQYKFQNALVFVFEPGSCVADLTSKVIDLDCNTMGYLGGVTGNTMINGEDFSDAVFMKTIRKK